MAIAKCGQMFSWGSPMWCCGKILVGTTKEKVEKMCISCPWWKGNRKEEEP